jgi:hypothetical protein
MRLSVRQEDKGYSIYASNYNVYLDGHEISYVFTADEERGYIERFQTDELGEPIIEGGQVKEERLYGTVKLMHRDDKVAKCQ